VGNEEVLHRVKEERNILHTIKRWKANWIGHILRRNCLLKHVIEGKLEGRIEMMGRWGRRCKQILDDLNTEYWKLKEEALDCSQWRSRFGRGYTPVVRQTTEWMNTLCYTDLALGENQVNNYHEFKFLGRCVYPQDLSVNSVTSLIHYTAIVTADGYETSPLY
jgi:hypothetical protein